MIRCRTCIRRTLGAFIGHALPLERNLPRGLGNLTRPAASLPPRSYATSATTLEAGQQELQDTAAPSEQNIQRPNVRSKKQAVSKSATFAATKTLEFAQDPLHIARHVQQMLGRRRFNEAAELTRRASRDAKVTVSWNYLIQHELQNHKLHAALKLFNEMKKRAQLPNAQTYTIIFKGCASSPHAKLAVAESIKLYQSMLQSDRLQPNTIHLNAVLQVCAKANDLDAMFSILDTTDGRNRKPDNMTYTTILNALRAEVLADRRRTDLPENQVKEAEQLALRRAKALWDDAVTQWRAGQILIDEELVCAMGRLLLLGSSKDVDSIFDLVSQTMNIPRQHIKGPAELPPIQKATSEVETTTDFGTPDPRNDDSDITLATTDLASSPGSKRPWASPGNNTLSLLMTTSESTRKTSIGVKYWTVLTKSFGVKPDAENWYQLLKVHRRGKSSANAVEAVKTMPKSYATKKVFGTAMATCVADNINPSSFNNATQIFELMVTQLQIPDPFAMRTYLRVAYANKRLFQQQSQKDPEAAKLAWGKQLTIAVDNLWGPYNMAARQLAFPVFQVPEEEERQIWLKDYDKRQETVALARKMIAACDRLITEQMVTANVEERLKTRRNRMNRFVVDYFAKKDKFEPGFSKADVKKEDRADDWEDVEQDDFWSKGK